MKTGYAHAKNVHIHNNTYFRFTMVYHIYHYTLRWILRCSLKQVLREINYYL
jgi:hypothetical protein